MSEPFRFLDLPSELRVMVYEHLFEGEKLLIDIPRRLEGSGDENRAPETEDAALPGLLLANKFIRREAVPVFSKQATACFHHLPNSKVGPRKIPPHYLRHIESALMGHQDYAWADVRDMPNLKELTVVLKYAYITGYTYGMVGSGPTSSLLQAERKVAGELCADLELFEDVDDLRSDEEGKSYEKARRATPVLPAKLLLSVGYTITVLCPVHPNRPGFSDCKDVVVDYHARKIVSASTMTCGCELVQ